MSSIRLGDVNDMILGAYRHFKIGPGGRLSNDDILHYSWRGEDGIKNAEIPDGLRALVDQRLLVPSDGAPFEKAFAFDLTDAGYAAIR